MGTATAPQLTAFGQDVISGLTDPVQKRLSPKYFYDDLGSALFEAITLLPEYGLTRADESLLAMHANEIVEQALRPGIVVELGSGSGRKTRHILRSLAHPIYRPIDISNAALMACASQLGDVAAVQPVEGEWLSSLAKVAKAQRREPILLLFLGSSIGNSDRNELPGFFSAVRECLGNGDHFLLGADLIKPVPTMLAAYDDPAGVTAAFNLNVLARINREFGANFNLRNFSHQARWNPIERAIEMHLISAANQTVSMPCLDLDIQFEQGETIWTESSHKFTLDELNQYAHGAAFEPVNAWVNAEWPFAEVLWRPA